MANWKILRNRQYSIEGLRKGNKDDFEAIFTEIYDLLYFLALSYVKNTGDAQDLIQDSFISLWENRENLKKDTRVHNYLYTIVKNNCLNHLKHLEVVERNSNSIRLSEIRFLRQSLNGLPGDFSVLEDLVHDLEAAIEALPDDLKKVFKMNRFENLTYLKIAGKTGLSVKTIESRMSRALKLLSKALADYLSFLIVINFMF